MSPGQLIREWFRADRYSTPVEHRRAGTLRHEHLPRVQKESQEKTPTIPIDGAALLLAEGRF